MFMFYLERPCSWTVVILSSLHDQQALLNPKKGLEPALLAFYTCYFILFTYCRLNSCGGTGSGCYQQVDVRCNFCFFFFFFLVLFSCTSNAFKIRKKIVFFEFHFGLMLCILMILSSFSTNVMYLGDFYHVNNFLFRIKIPGIIVLNPQNQRYVCQCYYVQFCN